MDVHLQTTERTQRLIYHLYRNIAPGAQNFAMLQFLNLAGDLQRLMTELSTAALWLI